MVGWHHRLNEHEIEQIPRDSEKQGSLACFSHGVAKSQLRTEQQQFIYLLTYLAASSLSWILLLLLKVKNVACSLKYTGWSILKVLIFKSVTLSHSYRDFLKVAEQRITFVSLEVYTNIMS